MKIFSLLTTAFIPQIPPINTLSKLERLLVSRAIGSSALSTISSEWSIERIVFEMVNYNMDNLWIVSTIIIYVFGYYKLYEMTRPIKIDQPVSDKWAKTVKDVLIMIFFVFSRDVKNAI